MAPDGKGHRWGRRLDLTPHDVTFAESLIQKPYVQKRKAWVKVRPRPPSTHPSAALLSPSILRCRLRRLRSPTPSLRLAIDLQSLLPTAG